MADKRRVVILFPTEHEAEPFTRAYGQAGSFAGVEYDVEICGIGPVSCPASVLRAVNQWKPDLVVLAGIAGAYPGSGLCKGDTVLVSRENVADLGAMRGENFVPLAQNGTDPAQNYYDCPAVLPDGFPAVVSNSVMCASTPYRNDSLAAAAIENMEGAAFFACCSAFGLPAVEIRTVSNIVGEHPSAWLMPRAAEILAGNLEKLIVDLNSNS